MKPSYVLEAIGLPEDEINNVVRFTFGENTREEIDIAIEEVKKAINLLRKFKQPKKYYFYLYLAKFFIYKACTRILTGITCYFLSLNF